eukprot:1849808-Amphidinium_carterae.1
MRGLPTMRANPCQIRLNMKGVQELAEGGVRIHPNASARRVQPRTQTQRDKTTWPTKAKEGQGRTRGTTGTKRRGKSGRGSLSQSNTSLPAKCTIATSQRGNSLHPVFPEGYIWYYTSHLQVIHSDINRACISALVGANVETPKRSKGWM